jgi:hypothetical protein
MDYPAADLVYFFGLMYNGVRHSTWDDMCRPGNAAIDSAIRLTVQYDCPNVAKSLVDMCDVRATTPKYEKEVLLFKLLESKRACPLVNMAHGFGLHKSVGAFLDALAELAAAGPTCCVQSMQRWRKTNYVQSFCPFNCKNDGWRTQHKDAANLSSASFDALDAPLHKMFFAKFYDKR